jgi:hypothetical protein
LLIQQLITNQGFRPNAITMAATVAVAVTVALRGLQEQQGSSLSSNSRNSSSHKDIMSYILLACALALMSLVICGMGCGPDVINDEEHDYRYQDQTPETIHESYISVVTRAYCAPHSAASFDSNHTRTQQLELSAQKKRAYLAAATAAVQLQGITEIT